MKRKNCHDTSTQCCIDRRRCSSIINPSCFLNSSRAFLFKLISRISTPSVCLLFLEAISAFSAHIQRHRRKWDTTHVLSSNIWNSRPANKSTKTSSSGKILLPPFTSSEGKTPFKQPSGSLPSVSLRSLLVLNHQHTHNSFVSSTNQRENWRHEPSGMTEECLVIVHRLLTATHTEQHGRIPTTQEHGEAWDWGDVSDPKPDWTPPRWRHDKPIDQRPRYPTLSRSSRSNNALYRWSQETCRTVGQDRRDIRHNLTPTRSIVVVIRLLTETSIHEVLDHMVEELDRNTDTTQSTASMDSYLKDILSQDASGPYPTDRLVAATNKRLNHGRLMNVLTEKSDPDQRTKLLKAEIRKVARDMAIREAKRQIDDRMESCFGDQEDSDWNTWLFWSERNPRLTAERAKGISFGGQSRSHKDTLQHHLHLLAAFIAEESAQNQKTHMRWERKSLEDHRHLMFLIVSYLIMKSKSNPLTDETSNCLLEKLPLWYLTQALTQAWNCRADFLKSNVTYITFTRSWNIPAV